MGHVGPRVQMLLAHVPKKMTRGLHITVALIRIASLKRIYQTRGIFLINKAKRRLCLCKCTTIIFSLLTILQIHDTDYICFNAPIAKWTHAPQNLTPELKICPKPKLISPLQFRHPYAKLNRMRMLKEKEKYPLPKVPAQNSNTQHYSRKYKYNFMFF